MLKVGIIGCGNIFTMHATSADHLKNATIVCVCDIKSKGEIIATRNSLTKGVRTNFFGYNSFEIFNTVFGFFGDFTLKYL